MMSQDSAPIDIDPASLEIFKTVLESPSGKEWFSKFMRGVFAETHFLIVPTHKEGRFVGFISNDYRHGEFDITIKPEDSWLKKWIKRQLM